MRKKTVTPLSEYRIMVVDDEIGIIDSISVMLKRSGYKFIGLTDPVEAVDLIKREHFDLLILDFLMQPIHGDEVVKRIRNFNKDIYILLLTGHKDLAPPLETIRALDIQGYCEKSDRFDQLLLLIESGIKSISQMNTIKKFKDGLNKILEAVPKIYQLQPIGNILEDILSELMPFANSKDAFILVDDTTFMSSGNKSIFKGIGKFNTKIENFIEMLSPGLIENIGIARVKKEVLRLDSGAVFPLTNEFMQSIGVIYVESVNIEEGIKLLEIYSLQASAALNNAFLHSLVNVKNEELNKTYDMLRDRYLDTIEVLRLTVDAKDYYTRGHSDRVAHFAVKIGAEFGLPEEQMELLRISGIFHDIGKIGTADDILLKTEKLNANEFEIIKMHPLKGAHILSAVSMFKEVVPLVRCHHEKVDGKGYPAGLKGDEIPFLSRILAAADAFDAMTSDRSYRTRLNLDEAVKQLKEGAGKQFDTDVIRVFCDLLKDYPKLIEGIREFYD